MINKVIAIFVLLAAQLLFSSPAELQSADSHYLKEYIVGTMTIPQGKIHGDLFEHKGKLYSGTHVGLYERGGRKGKELQ